MRHLENVSSPAAEWPSSQRPTVPFQQRSNISSPWRFSRGGRSAPRWRWFSSLPSSPRSHLQLTWDQPQLRNSLHFISNFFLPWLQRLFKGPLELYKMWNLKSFLKNIFFYMMAFLSVSLDFFLEKLAFAISLLPFLFLKSFLKKHFFYMMASLRVSLDFFLEKLAFAIFT